MIQDAGFTKNEGRFCKNRYRVEFLLWNVSGKKFKKFQIFGGSGGGSEESRKKTKQSTPPQNRQKGGAKSGQSVRT